MELDFTSLENALIMLGQRLLRSKQHYEVVAIGGASLVLLGYIDRTTKDLDLVAMMEAGRSKTITSRASKRNYRSWDCS